MEVLLCILREGAEKVCVRGGWADENRNVKKLSYATPPTGLGAKPKAWKLSESPTGEKSGWTGGRRVCVRVRVAACRPAHRE